METKKLTTKKGREVIFTLHRHTNMDTPFRSPIPMWSDDEIRAFVDGEDVGYLKISYIPKKNAKLLFPDVLTFMHRNNSNLIFPSEVINDHLGPVDYSSMSDGQLRELLIGLTLTFFGGWSDRQNAIKRMDKREMLVMLKEYMRVSKRKNGPDYKKFLETYVDKPFVNFIKVFDNFQQTGIATLLYVITSKWLQERGMYLYAGDPQTDRAKEIWNRMEDKGWVLFDGKRRFIDPNSI